MDRPVPRTCHDANGIQICLHTANEPARDDVTIATTALAQAGLGPLLGKVTDYTASETHQPAPGEALLRLDPGPFIPRDAIQNVREGATDAIATSLTIDRCPLPQEGSATEQQELATQEKSYALLRRVLTLAGFDNLAQGWGTTQEAAEPDFDAKDADELTVWVQRHRDQVYTCTITAEQDR